MYVRMIKTEYFDETMTVAELREALSAFPDDTPVITAGCDCMGAAHRLKLEDGHVEILREPGDGMCSG